MSRFSRMSIVFRRLLGTAIVLVGVVSTVFVVQRIVPGDPAEILLGDHATPQQLEALRERMGLNQPLTEQYLDVWKGILDGTLGTSQENADRPRTVMSVLREHAPATVELALAGVVFALMIALPLGVISGLRPWSAWDQGSAVLALAGVAIPNFFLGPLLLHWFSVEIHLFPDPGQPLAGLSTLILPALVLGTALAAKLTRMIRASVLDQVNAPHVLAARSRGLSSSRIVIHYILRGAMVPVVTILALQFASLLTGTIVLEKVFARPGLGSLLLDGVASRNHTLVQGIVLLFSFAYVFVNGLADVVHTALDPRLRLGGGHA